MSRTRSIPQPVPDVLAVDRDSVRLAAIDIGSNSIHMIVAQINADGTMTNLWRVKEAVGLGRLSFPSHRLSREAMDQAMGALTRILQAARQRRVEKILAVATSAVREAHNGGDFIERVRRKLRLDVRVVSAREEARLIYVAVRHAAPLGSDPEFIIDVGGGSVELIVGNDRQTLLLESRKLGAARMTAQHVKTDPISDEEKASLLKHYDHDLTSICEQIIALKPVGAIGTSGTLENLAEMCSPTPPASANAADAPLIIERARFQEMVAELVKAKPKDRAKMPGLDPQRQDQIVAGALLVNEFFERLKLRKIRICRSALREGIVLDYIQRHMPEIAIRREVPDPRRRSVLGLARRCEWNRVHSEHVTRLTLELFDDLKSLHGLGAGERELIEYGAMLHDIGWHIGHKSHHKHSMYLILHGGLKGFTPEEIQIVANIARYHRKSPPKSKHPDYQVLSPRAKQIVDIGAGILRIADGMDRSHGAVIQEVRCTISDDEIVCTLSAKSDAALELWAAKRKDDLFTKAFGRDITFRLIRR
ncbi:MAG TPA: Ppx/GppA phosphatase family protein [Tepidisphaeraceae bacterium]|jgi:exopolyphosphatase/guanosine-5'-triphosphate,3'-diphosphate pyrophosphatase|nr:Ppx/GppA phosphatase family protein [Tepidisphaeraceae bacterium]